MENMNVSDQIINVINQIADKLGVAVEKVYPILRKQAIVEGCTNVFWIVVIIAGCLIIISKLIKNIKKTNDEDKQFWSGVVVLITIIAGILFMPSIKDTITAFVNPDWYVFNELLMNLIN